MKRIYTPVKKMTILIVDDDQIVLHIYREKFTRQGFKVEIADTGARAIRILQQSAVDLVILDLCLPETNGIDLLQEIRAKSKTASLPVIVFSNSYLGRPMREALAAGATRCVSKAEFAPTQMLNLVRELLTQEQGAPLDPSLVIVGPVSETVDKLEAEPPQPLVAKFLASGTQTLARLRAGYLLLARGGEDELLPTELFEMHRQVHLLAGTAGVLSFQKIARLANAVEALLSELQSKPKQITPSVIRTLGQAIDALAISNDEAAIAGPSGLEPPRILVVDDEAISREAICSALAKAGLAPVSMGDSLQAEELLGQEHFDLIFLDVEMPGRSGLELCLNIRDRPPNRTTPVVFVTSHSDFGTQAQSVLNGGNDFILKPFLLVELALKALTWLSRRPVQPLAAVVPQQSLGGTEQGDAEQPVIELNLVRGKPNPLQDLAAK